MELMWKRDMSVWRKAFAGGRNPGRLGTNFRSLGTCSLMLQRHDEGQVEGRLLVAGPNGCQGLPYLED